jgi:toxin CptA
MLWSLALLAPCSLLASDLPRAWAWPAMLIAGGWAIRDARRYQGLPARLLEIPGGSGVARCDGERIGALQVRWRGPMAFLCWRDARGVRHRASCWPDTLPAGMRRELRVAMQKREAASGGPSMAG